MKKYLSVGITSLLAVACATPDYSISEQASAYLRGRVAFPPVPRDFFEYHFHKELSKIPSSSYPAIYSLGWASAFDDPNNCGWDFHVIGEAPKVIEVTFSGNGFSKTYKAETEAGANGYFENEVLQRNLLLYMIPNVSIADRKAWEESEVSVRIKGSSDIFKFYIPKSESPVLLWNRGYEYPFLADRKQETFQAMRVSPMRYIQNLIRRRVSNAFVFSYNFSLLGGSLLGDYLSFYGQRVFFY